MTFKFTRLHRSLKSSAEMISSLKFKDPIIKVSMKNMLYC